jgi:hypothetical protein
MHRALEFRIGAVKLLSNLVLIEFDGYLAAEGRGIFNVDIHGCLFWDFELNTSAGFGSTSRADSGPPIGSSQKPAGSRG